MDCQSPLKKQGARRDIEKGFLYRSGGEIVRVKDSEGISCRSSICTEEILGIKISAWKIDCRDNICNGANKQKAAFYWTMPIADLELEECTIQFETTWDGTLCDQAHCLIKIYIHGELMDVFSEIREDFRNDIGMHLKRGSISQKQALEFPDSIILH